MWKPAEWFKERRGQCSQISEITKREDKMKVMQEAETILEVEIANTEENVLVSGSKR